MTDTPPATDELTEVSIGKDGIKLKGVYEDFRPTARAASEICTTILLTVGNAVSLPCDILNHYFTRFRSHFRDRWDQIPESNRTSPEFRVACAVVKEVVSSAEEPTIQEMFASLLATSCDTSTRSMAHPGFAQVINQLAPLDAQVLNVIVKASGSSLFSPPILKSSFIRSSLGEDNFAATGVALDNLARLGLIDWTIGKRIPPTSTGLNPTLPALKPSFVADRSLSDIYKTTNTLDRAVKDIASSVENLETGLKKRSHLVLTYYGAQFVRTCLPIERSTDPAANE